MATPPKLEWDSLYYAVPPNPCPRIAGVIQCPRQGCRVTKGFRVTELLPVGVLCNPSAILLRKTAFESPLRAAPQAKCSGGSSGSRQGGLLGGWGLQFGALGSPVAACVAQFPWAAFKGCARKRARVWGRRVEAAAQKMPPTPSRRAPSVAAGLIYQTRSHIELSHC